MSRLTPSFPLGESSCAVFTLTGHDRVGMLEYAVDRIGPDRVLFGSDFSINDPSTVIARIEHSFLAEEQKKKVLSENLQALLKRVQRKS